MNDTQAPLDVYTFGPAWDIPVLTASPFGVKLITWLRMQDLPHRVHVENNPGKGPKGKCPWVMVDGQALGDSEMVIETIKQRRGIRTDTGLTPQQLALATAVRLMLEDHFHQVWEHELFIFDGGWKRAYEFFDQLPPGVRVLVRNVARSALRKQLHARGVGRHTHEQIVQMGIEDLDVIETLLGDGPFFFGEEPRDIDATVFGFLSLTYWTPSESPVWANLRSRRALCDYCERIRERYY
ncbi:glutathione S-transferase family protein [Paraliomyxa miuraensis]|uniref:glutathione S-transferase family protein n=1 Tax=Paraliomyxa miuraensis TaxID=376150 RepID=UPI00224F0A37|nr:glutathione S-transferase family protein [Paraliomyxa miuraensis]